MTETEVLLEFAITCVQCCTHFFKIIISILFKLNTFLCQSTHIKNENLKMFCPGHEAQVDRAVKALKEGNNDF